MKFKILYLILSLLVVSCSQSSDGFAPTETTLPPIIEPTNDNNFKYGETVTTSGGWEASLDTTDSINDINIANGWVVEVKYE